MPIESSLITEQRFVDHLNNNLDGTETLTYYIHDELDYSYPVGNGFAETWTHLTYEEDYIVSVFDSIDSQIDLDFTRVYSDNGSDLDIYSLSTHTSWSASVVGTTWAMGSGVNSWFDIAWAYTGSSNADWLFDRSTIIHEIGHSLGLGHPDGSGFNPNYTTDDTVMSYNEGLNGWSVDWTQSDIDALLSIWGAEDDNSISTTSTESNSNISNYTIGTLYELENIRDYDGNLHAGASQSAQDQYKHQGQADLDGDGTKEDIFTNQVSGRWASVGSDGDFGDYGEGGSTRVVGTYSDPLVLSGEVAAGGPHDSQTRFQNDLWADNLSLGVGGDFDSDGTQEVYWRTNDGSAYLRSLHHADGNIQYANYQNYAQMSDYLTTTGNTNLISTVVG